MRHVFILIMWLATSLLSPAMANAQGVQSCRFQLSFATLSDILSGTVGNCVDDESHNPTNGDAVQHTTGGLLVWRKADNWTAYTDGDQSWVMGPNGVKKRLNTERFVWEDNPSFLPYTLTTEDFSGPFATATEPQTSAPYAIIPCSLGAAQVADAGCAGSASPPSLSSILGSPTAPVDTTCTVWSPSRTFNAVVVFSGRDGKTLCRSFGANAVRWLPGVLKQSLKAFGIACDIESTISKVLKFLPDASSICSRVESQQQLDLQAAPGNYLGPDTQASARRICQAYLTTSIGQARYTVYDTGQGYIGNTYCNYMPHLELTRPTS